ncbi:MAG: hypothetical protein SGCHY_003127, partial [Lobulomycetales sp.]
REEEARLQWGGAKICDLDLPKAVTVPKSGTLLKDAVEIMQSQGFDQLPVTTSAGKLVGMLTLGDVMSKVSSGRASMTDPVTKVMWSFIKKGSTTGNKDDDYVEITTDTLLENLSGFFEKNSCAVVTSKDGDVVHVVTKVDLLAYLMKHPTITAK